MNDGTGIGKQPKADPSGIDNMGKPIGAESREAGNKALKDMGVSHSGSRWDCVQGVCDSLERDKPHEAMKKAMRYVDAIGGYRLFAELLVPRGGK